MPQPVRADPLSQSSMSVFFDTDARPHCKHCGQSLPGYAESGHCPHCGKWFSVERASVAPSRVRAIALLMKSAPAIALRENPAWMGVASVLLLLVNAGVVIFLGRWAVRALYHACGMTP